ncbi:MAG: HAMP domain-containing protein [Bdellovibrio sp.]|nr:HAMP domain-containing protein [Bdellovibrio sp.]
MFLKTISLRTRLTFLFAIIFGTTTILFSGFLYYFLNDSLAQDFDDALYNYAVDVSKNIEIGTKDNLLFPPLKVDEGKIFPFPSGTALIQVQDTAGHILVRSGEFGDFQFPFKKDITKILKGQDSSYRTLTNTEKLPDAEAESYRLITFPLDSVAAPDLFLQIAVPMTTFEKQLDSLQFIIKLGLPAVLLVAVFAGFYFSSRALRPVKDIIEKTISIDASDLTQRVPLPKSKDEIKQLAETQNAMLDRIEKAFKSQERFIADASHQLLTPLTILRGEIEVQQKTNSPDPQFLTSALEEVKNLTRIVKDMLLLARIDAGLGALEFSEIEIDDILIDVIARLQKLATTKNIHIKFDIIENAQPSQVRGDYDLLSNLFFNLIENAIKYSSVGSPIFIRVIWNQDQTIVEIEDEGPGIPEENQKVIFDRFSRLAPSGQTKGFGLGLAIANKIAVLHKAELGLQPKPGKGTLFVFKVHNLPPHNKIS